MVHSVFGGFSILQGEWLKTINAPLPSFDSKRTRNDRKKLVVSLESNNFVVEEEVEATLEAGVASFCSGSTSQLHSDVPCDSLRVKKTLKSRETREKKKKIHFLQQKDSKVCLKLF